MNFGTNHASGAGSITYVTMVTLCYDCALSSWFNNVSGCMTSKGIFSYMEFIMYQTIQCFKQYDNGTNLFLQEIFNVTDNILIVQTIWHWKLFALT